jgi:chromate transporter
VGVAFVLPSFLIVLVLSALYLRYGGLPWMQGAFYGVGAAVIALIAHSAWRLTRKTVGTDPLLWGLVLVNAVVTAWTQREIVWLFLASGLVVMLWGTRARWLPNARTAAAVVPLWLGFVLPDSWTRGLHGPQPLGRLGELAAFFAKAGAVVFGSGLAIVPFLHGTVVQQQHWLTERQFLDAVAVAMITPGPVVITVAFIGYLVAGPLGATAAAVGVFLPVYLLVILFARWYRRVAASISLRLAVDGVTAAATGAIAGAAFVLGRRAVVDLPTAAIFAGALAVVLLVRRVPEPILVLAAAAVGLALRGGQP